MTPTKKSKNRFKISNSRNKSNIENDLKIYFEAQKRAEHLEDTIKHVRQLAYGTALVLPVLGVFKDFSGSANKASSLDYVTLVSDFNLFLIHDLKIPFILVFSILSFILIIIARYVETEIYLPQLHGILAFLINFERDFKKIYNTEYVGFKDGIGTYCLEGAFSQIREGYFKDQISKELYKYKDDDHYYNKEKKLMFKIYDDERKNSHHKKKPDQIDEMENLKKYCKIKLGFIRIYDETCESIKSLGFHYLFPSTFSLASLGLIFFINGIVGLYCLIFMFLIIMFLIWYFKFYPNEYVPLPLHRSKDKIKKTYNLFAFWVMYLGIVVGYLINIDSCQMRNAIGKIEKELKVNIVNENQYSNTFFKCNAESHFCRCEKM